MNEEACVVGLGERVEHDRGTLRFARHFPQASICGTAGTRRSDKDKNKYDKTTTSQVRNCSVLLQRVISIKPRVNLFRVSLKLRTLTCLLTITHIMLVLFVAI